MLLRNTSKPKENESNLVVNSVLRFELKPTPEQQRRLFHTLDLCRKLYNLALEERIRHYRETGQGLTYRDQQNRLPSFKKENPEYKTVQSQVLQDALRRLENAFVNFFEKRASFPRFKEKLRYRSITLPQCNAERNFGKTGYIYFPKIGHIKFIPHQPFDSAQVKIINIKHQNGKWYANLTIEISGKSPETNAHCAVGIDLGLTSLVVTSDGDYHDHPKWIQRSEKRLKKAQRNVSKKNKGSANRHRAKIKLQRLHDRVANQRKDYLHKLSIALVRKHDIICMEDLQVKRMMKNHRLARSIANASWNRLTNYISYKCERYGKLLIKVDPRDTTQLCSTCGEPVKKLLSDRIHQCPVCGLELDRDLNAARNILQRGLRRLA
jgi:putative transposase